MKTTIQMVNGNKINIHELSADEVETLELGVPIDLGGGHYVQSTDYVKKMINDDIEFNKFNQEYEPEI